MPHRVIRSRGARADELDIWLHIAGDSVRAADGTLDNFDEATRTLAQFPLAGRAREELAEGLRSFVVGSYLIFYRVRKDAVEIARILHGARDIGPELFRDASDD